MLKFGAKVQKSSKASYLGNIKIIMTLVGEWDIYPLFQRRLDNPGVTCVKPTVGCTQPIMSGRVQIKSVLQISFARQAS